MSHQFQSCCILSKIALQFSDFLYSVRSYWLFSRMIFIFHDVCTYNWFIRYEQLLLSMNIGVRTSVSVCLFVWSIVFMYKCILACLIESSEIVPYDRIGETSHHYCFLKSYHQCYRTFSHPWRLPSWAFLMAKSASMRSVLLIAYRSFFLQIWREEERRRDRKGRESYEWRTEGRTNIGERIERIKRIERINR